MEDGRGDNNPTTLPFLKILDGMPTAIWVYDVESNAIMWGNRNAWQVWGVDSIEELRKKDLRGYPPANLSIMLAYKKKYELEFNSSGSISSHDSDVWTIFSTGMPSFRLTHTPHTFCLLFYIHKA